MQKGPYVFNFTVSLLQTRNSSKMKTCTYVHLALMHAFTRATRYQYKLRIKTCTYVHLALVHVLGLAGAVLGLLAKDQEQLEEEDVPLSALAEDLLGVPDLERILQDHLPVGREVVLERAGKRWKECNRDDKW